MESDLTRIVKRVIDENKKNKKEMDWKKMGFKSNEDYLKFLDTTTVFGKQRDTIVT